jgi:acetylornithine deacetylase/succinyl-diaminopimelate desuccinylase-like protein
MATDRDDQRDVRIPRSSVGTRRRGFRADRRPPLRVGGGGSIPVITDFDRVLGAPVLLLGFGPPGENPHAPNEHFDLDNFDRGMRTAATLWAQLGAGQPGA